jgi:hypothetical protein
MKTKLQLLFVTLGLAALSAAAQVPGIISHQGKVTVNGTNYTGSGQFKFALVDAAGTNTYWSNDGSSSGGVEPTSAVTLSTARGVFSVNLGDTNVANMTQAIPADAFTNSAVYLRTWFNDGVDGSQLLTPDRQITSVGYALVAANFTGTLSLAQLPTGVVTNNETDVALSGTFSGNGVGSFNGDGSGLTGLNASELIGTVPLAQLPPDVLINYASGVDLTGTFTGSFNGDGSGLTGLNATQLTGTVPLAQLPPGVLINGSGASGPYSIALGLDTTANGFASTALGASTTASGSVSTAMGNSTTASGWSSTALGVGTTASGDNSTAMGLYTTASEQSSTALGAYTEASSYGSTAMGNGTTASGWTSTAMGNNAQATNDYSFVWADGQSGIFTSTTTNEFSVRAGGGVRFVTGGGGLTVDGQRVLTNGDSMTGSFTGNGSGLTGLNAANLTGAIGVTQLPPGVLTNNASGVSISGTFSGNGNGLTSLNAQNLVNGVPLAQLPPGVLINGSGASAQYSTALGVYTSASGTASTAMGDSTTASGGLSTAMGVFTTASGFASTAMGNHAQATNDYSFVWADGQGEDFTSTTNNEFSVRAGGGVRFVTGGAGVTVDGQPLLTNLNAAQLTGTIPLAQLPAGVLTNGSGASGPNSIALGYSTTASGSASTALGYSTTASGSASTALGINTTASGPASTAMGNDTTASGWISTAMGNNAQATNDYSFVWADGQGGPFTSTTNNEFSVRAGGGVRFVTGGGGLTVAASGNVGIGTTTPLYTLQVNGSVAGTSAYNNLSDARLKQDVQPIGNALAIVEALRGVTYNWNQAVDPSLKLDDRNHVGFLAQEVEKVLPQAVSTANDARQTKSVAYSEVIPVLNEAIKQQQTQIETLQAENDELKARLDALEAKLGQ